MGNKSGGKTKQGKDEMSLMVLDASGKEKQSSVVSLNFKHFSESVMLSTFDSIFKNEILVPLSVKITKLHFLVC